MSIQNKANQIMRLRQEQNAARKTMNAALERETACKEAALGTPFDSPERAELCRAFEEHRTAIDAFHAAEQALYDCVKALPKSEAHKKAISDTLKARNKNHERTTDRA